MSKSSDVVPHLSFVNNLFQNISFMKLYLVA